MGSHIIDGEFQSDKYPTCPAGKVPLSTKDTTAQDLLWEYAQRRRAVDPEFANDLELTSEGFRAAEGAHDGGRGLPALHVRSQRSVRRSRGADAVAPPGVRTEQALDGRELHARWRDGLRPVKQLVPVSLAHRSIRKRLK